MSHKSLAQLEIGSPEWVAMRQAMTGNTASPRADVRPSTLALGAVALAASAIVLGVLRLSAMMMAKRH